MNKLDKRKLPKRRRAVVRTDWVKKIGRKRAIYRLEFSCGHVTQRLAYGPPWVWAYCYDCAPPEPPTPQELPASDELVIAM